jgi:RND family efflux transporter MFP subunit
VRAEAAARLARADDDRTRALLANGYVAARQADASRTAVVDAEQQVAAARAQLASTEQASALTALGPRAEDRAEASAGAEAARAAVAQARTLLGKTAIVAPVDAYVEARQIEPGDTAAPGATAFVLTDAATPEVAVAVPEASISRLRIGSPALVIAGSGRFTGTVFRIEPAADAASRTARVRVRVNALPLHPGSIVDVSLGVQPVAAASVAVGSVLVRAGRRYVELYDASSGTVHCRPVRVLQSDEERAIVKGVEAGEAVVTQGQHEAQPGDPVRVVSR